MVFPVAHDGARHPAERVVAIGQSHGGILLKRHAHHHAAVTVLHHLVRDVVSEGIDQHVAATLRIRVHFNGLHHMGMPADDVVHTLCEEPVGQFTLCGIGHPCIFNAPMHDGDDGIWLHGFRLSDVLFHLATIDEVDYVWAGYRKAICPIGIVEQGEAEAPFFHDQWVVTLTLQGVGIGAKVGNAEAVEHEDSAFNPPTSTVTAMVVGRGQYVEARIADSCEKLVGSGEGGIARIRPSS